MKALDVVKAAHTQNLYIIPLTGKGTDRQFTALWYCNDGNIKLS